MVAFDQLPAAAGLYDPAQESDACGVGFIADLSGAQTVGTVRDGLAALANMEHRGACGCEVETGDGAGVCAGMPREFIRAAAAEAGFGDALPQGDGALVAVGNVFFRREEPELRRQCVQLLEQELAQVGCAIAGWRVPPTDNSSLGRSALLAEPEVAQIFVIPSEPATQEHFETVLFLARKRTTHKALQLVAEDEQPNAPVYFCSLSSKTIVYKGMLRTHQLSSYYPDLLRDDFKTHVVSFHSRFSTNTFPAWSRAHPYRFLCHNGEINTLIGNRNWMAAREGQLQSDILGDGLKSALPIIERNNSDSQSLDNVLELLVRAGRSLPEAVLMMVPEAWQNSTHMDDKKRAFYQYYSSIMEPWDGPALVLFNDGDMVGAVLDRNGLRPCRFYVTNDNRIICGSEAGLLPQIPSANIVQKGRLQPGKMLLADIQQGRIVDDAEIKARFASMHPYGDWIANKSFTIQTLLSNPSPVCELTAVPDSFADENAYLDWEEASLQKLKAFGYSTEHLELLLRPMAADGMEALGSMGNDAPLAFLSETPRTVYDYFKQLFAQVTNPPVDPIRESIVMSCACYIGPEHNMLSTTEEHASRLYLENPILSMEELAALENISHRGWKSKVLDMTYDRTEGPPGLEVGLRRLCEEASNAIKEGYQFVILSDRNLSFARVRISGLLAVAAVHQYLVSKAERTQIGVILDSGEPREVHHMCCLFGYGVDAVCPYMAYAACIKLRHDHNLPETLTSAQIQSNLKKAYYKGLLKVMAKMGIATIQSYKGAQIFEAVGLGKEVIGTCFAGTASRVGGSSFERLGVDTLRLHERGFPRRPSAKESVAGLGTFGEYHWRAGSMTERHINDPAAIAQLQVAARNDSRKAYDQFAKLHNEGVRGSTLRGLLKIKSSSANAIPLEDVEPAKDIVKRFRTGAMSYGSISIETHVALARAMNRMGAKSNSGEGGEDAERFTATVEGDALRSSIKQVASGRFGVTIDYLSNADELQIKMAQGAKPGEGGELPGWKVSDDIAKTRHSTPGVGLISPPPHHDIYSIEDLAQLIFDLKNSNPSSNVSVKLVSKLGVGVIASGVAKGKADHILVSGHDGGTGASRWTGIKHAGLPWELGIAETHQTLVLNGLRGRVSLETDGHLRTGRDVAVAAMLGAEQFGFGTAPLISLGCIMMRKCHLNTCPVGVATQDPELRAKFKGAPEHVVNYFFLIAEELREIMASVGVRSVSELVGRTDLLAPDETATARGLEDLDLSKLLTPAFSMTADTTRHENRKLYEQDHELESVLDRRIYAAVKREMERALPKKVEFEVHNVDRSVGAILSHEVSKCHSNSPMAEGTIHVKLNGTAGQSCGAWLASGVLLEVEGDCNDYAGKGLSGGALIVYPPRETTFKAEDQVIIGNVALYGATSGKAFFRGRSAERFAVRNSGAYTVIEGVGDHACEYMTGGRVVILGDTGINFGAGMSGGLAYVYDPNRTFGSKCNHEIVDLVSVDSGSPDEAELRALISEHQEHTGSSVAADILSAWSSALAAFVKVFPRDYKRVLEERRAAAEKSAIQSNGVAPAVVVANGNGAANPGPDRSESSSPTRDTSSPIMSDIEDIAGGRPTVVDSPKKKRGFVEYARRAETYRPAKDRLADFTEIYSDHDHKKLNTQAARCMDCGIPFCQSGPGCPLGNKIPEWNELVYGNKWREALERLLQTNNFPEFTGRVCPAPCEGSCCLGVIEDPVTIKNIECAIIDHAFEQGWMLPQPPEKRTGKRIAIVGSGPAGMAAADQLNKAGHWVTVYERADRVGGLMMYGVPNMKADKTDIVQRRVDLMAKEGVKFVTGSDGNIAGTEWLLSEQYPSSQPTQAQELVDSFDAVLLATGSVIPRDLKISGRELKGIHFAMEFLTKNTKALLDSGSVTDHWRARAKDGEFIDARDKHVVVIGGGDTGNDCIGTSMRHGAKSVVNFELLPSPPETRAADNPWPEWPKIFRVDYGHEEVEARDGSDPRQYLICSKEFIDDGAGNLKGIRTVRVEWTKDENGAFKMSEVPGSEEVFEADLCFLAMGFIGPQKEISTNLGLDLDRRGNYLAEFGKYKTNRDKVFAAGDCRRGQSLVVWAIAEGRQAAREMDRYLMGDTLLP